MNYMNFIQDSQNLQQSSIIRDESDVDVIAV